MEGKIFSPATAVVFKKNRSFAMKSQEKPGLETGSKVFTKKSNINKKKAVERPDQLKKSGISILKKNEFALILFGALLFTIIIFFFFFRSSDSKTEVVKQNISKTSFSDFEKRIVNIEKILQPEQDSDSKNSKTKQNVTQNYHINDRLSRLEAAFSVKFDSLIDRMEQLEKNIEQLKNRPVKKTVIKATKLKTAVPVKKTVKKKPMFHTVKKNETLYSISKQYNTTIDTLRKLNKLSKGAKIYPGDNLLVR